MSKKILIDASYEEETRLAIVQDKKIEEFDCELAYQKQEKGNIYLAKIVRVEPALQAAFVDYGADRHGFLSFNEIHPDYFQIPVDDKKRVLEKIRNEIASKEIEIEFDCGGNDTKSEDRKNNDEDVAPASDADEDMTETEGEDNTPANREDPSAEADEIFKQRLHQHYKIQEVMKAHQVVLVQVMKEGRGSKGASLSTYVSLVGRYCILMPNTLRKGGISKKITDNQERQKLLAVMESLELPETMGVVIRTAGLKRTRIQIKKDFENLQKLWDSIRQRTLESTAPALIQEEGNLLRRCLRDMYTKEVGEIVISGESLYQEARTMMRDLGSSHVRYVKLHDPQKGPIFRHYGVEAHIQNIYRRTVPLPSGGSLVFDQAEALVAIDVNSGRSIHARNAHDTAFKTNLEAAEEVARHLRARDLAGLVVIDFIDMSSAKHRAAVERKLKDCLRQDRAKVNVGRISPFGLLEMSRQRLRPSLVETARQVCPSCQGMGWMLSTESLGLAVLRALDEEFATQRDVSGATVITRNDVASYLLNQKRRMLLKFEEQKNITVTIQASSQETAWTLTWEASTASTDAPATSQKETVSDASADPAKTASAKTRSRRRRRSRRSKGQNTQQDAMTTANSEDTAVSEDKSPNHEETQSEPASSDTQKKGWWNRLIN